MLVTHEPDIAAFAARVVVMKDGAAVDRRQQARDARDALAARGAQQVRQEAGTPRRALGGR